MNASSRCVIEPFRIKRGAWNCALRNSTPPFLQAGPGGYHRPEPLRNAQSINCSRTRAAPVEPMGTTAPEAI